MIYSFRKGKVDKESKSNLFSALKALLIASLPLITCLLSIKIYNLNYARKWQQLTSPLPVETVMDLCQKYQLSSKDPLCNGEKEVYGPDFYPVIEKHLRQVKNDVNAYEIVAERLGPYVEYCESERSKEYFRCRYDLRGDGVGLIIIFFYKNDRSIERYFLTTHQH